MSEFKKENPKLQTDRRDFFKKIMPEAKDNKQDNAISLENTEKTKDKIDRRAIGVLAATSLLSFIASCKKESSEENIKQDKIGDKALESVANYSELRNDLNEQIKRELLKDKDVLIPALEKKTKLKDINTRYNAYHALYLIAEQSETDKQEIISILQSGLNDPDPVNKARASAWLLALGEKQGISALIDISSKEYGEMIVPVEPPLAVDKFASAVLLNAILLDEEVRNLGIVKWWDKYQDQIHWDPKIKKYRLVK